MFRLRALLSAFALASLLTACGESPPPTEPTGTTPASASSAPRTERPATPPGSDLDLPALRAQYANEPLTVAEVGEVEIDGANALVASFSLPLDPAQDLDALLKLSDGDGKPLDAGWVFSPDLRDARLLHVEPERVLNLTISPDLRSIAGVPLGSASTHNVATAAQPPMVGFVSRGSLLPTEFGDGLPVLALNVERVDIDFFRVRPQHLDAVLAEWSGNSVFYIEEANTVQDRAELVYSGRFALAPARNTRERLMLPLDGIAPLAEPGVYVAIMRRSGQYDYQFPVTLFSRSNVALNLRQSARQFDAFVQSLSDGAPLSGISVELRDSEGRSLAQASSDRNGHARLPADPKAQMVVATRGAEFTVIRLGDSALDLSEFSIAGAPAQPHELFVFGPRDLYRPGEQVVLNGLLRDADGRHVDARPIPARVIRPDGDEARSFVWQTADDAPGGLYQFRYPLAADAQTGRWKVLFDVGGRDPVTYSFLVEDFLPERLALDLTRSGDAAGTGNAPLAADTSFAVDVNGRYLYGAPANGNKLVGQVFVQPLREAVATLPGFEFGDVTDGEQARSTDLEELWLDAQGRGTLAIGNDWSSTRSPLRITVQASVQESGGRPVTRRLEVPVWPAPALLGIRPLFADHTVDPDSAQDARFQIVLADAAGTLLGAEQLEVRLIEERRNYVWRHSEEEGWTSDYTTRDIVLSRASHALTAGERLEVALPVSWGYYRVEVRDPARKLLSSVRFEAGWREQETTAAGNVRPDQVRLALDQPRYRAGDTARVRVEAPAAGQGFLMVESSEGALWWQAIEVPADGTTFDVPVDAAWARHDLYVSALVVRPGSREAHRVPRRAVGVLHLPLDREERRIAVALDAPATMRPERALPVRVSAPALAGQTVQVLVSAVDVGILNLNRFVTPDPFVAFFGRKRYGIDQRDIYGQLIEVGDARRASLAFGGDEAREPGGRAPITSVTLVAQQAQPVTLDAQGHGEVSIDIPAFNGELRVMAQAWSADAYGVSEGKTVVAAPLVVELAAPRFLAGADRAELALDITNLTDTPQQLDARLSYGGLLVAPPSTAFAPQMLQLAPGERHTLRAPVMALGGTGEGTVTLTVNGLSLPDEATAPLVRTWPVGVRPAWPAQTTYHTATLGDGASKRWQLAKAVPDYARLDDVSLRLSFADRPPLDLASHIAWLRSYPYGCAEQTTSGLYPSLYATPDVLAALGLGGDTPQKRQQNIETGIERLLTMQLANGGFALWSRDGVEVAWLTPYVADFLLRAAEQGFSVPADALKRTRERLLSYVQSPMQTLDPLTGGSRELTFAARSYAAWVLARHAQVPLGTLREMAGLCQALALQSARERRSGAGLPVA